MYYSAEQLTVEQKKRKLKRLVSRFFEHHLIWLIFGFVIGTTSTVYGVVESIKAIDKVMVCK